MTTYYTYEHHAGYGRDDHRADELIARAARRLGADTTSYIAQAIGLASHPVPLGSVSVRLPAGRHVRARMQAALRAARAEIGHAVDTSISVACLRERVEYTRERRPWCWDLDGGDRPADGMVSIVTGRTRIIERREGHRWVVIGRQEED